ncbi:hypothetical protein NE237_032781 [Protea cynaroides]|uniref:Uncharacterized protein n=1 Tax=Protea cynaroides TaxID=273540 RepID=A0A9Q0R3Q4_9MAGN|nr:hypothetical protein NE237_032781 [Protea cynaroides]
MKEMSSSFEGDCLGDALEMGDDKAIYRENFQKFETDSLLDMGDEDLDTVDTDDGEALGKESSKTSYDAKLRELLRNIHSPEVKIYSQASKEFIRLLRSDSGGELLHQYVQASPLCLELIEAWKLRQEKPGLMYVQSLISVILDHPDGKYKSHDIGRITISWRLDKFARSIIKTKLEDIYTELNIKETKHQNAALLLMAAVVWRGVGLKRPYLRSAVVSLFVLKSKGKEGLHFDN